MKIIRIPECASLMTVMKECGEFPVAFITDYQTAGHGQYERHWESERGKNLLCGFVFDSSKLKTPDNVSRHAVECVMKTLDDFLENSGFKTRFKSPNDIYIGDKKVCGMLIENDFLSTSMKISRIGLGINVNQEIFYSDAPNPISLKNVLKKDVDVDKVFAKLIDNFFSI